MLTTTCEIVVLKILIKYGGHFFVSVFVRFLTGERHCATFYMALWDNAILGMIVS